VSSSPAWESWDHNSVVVARFDFYTNRCNLSRGLGPKYPVEQIEQAAIRCRLIRVVGDDASPKMQCQLPTSELLGRRSSVCRYLPSGVEQQRRAVVVVRARVVRERIQQGRTPWERDFVLKSEPRQELHAFQQPPLLPSEA
jgi:hypothetical protein